MPDQTKTIVVIERHEQTIILRSRRLISGEMLMTGVAGSLLEGFVTAEHRAVAKPSERASVESFSSLCATSVSSAAVW